MVRLLRSITGLVLALPEGGGSGAQGAPDQRAHHPTRNTPAPARRQESSSITSSQCLPRLRLGIRSPSQEKQWSLWGRLGEPGYPREVQSRLGVYHLSGALKGREGSQPQSRQGKLKELVLQVTAMAVQTTPPP